MVTVKFTHFITCMSVIRSTEKYQNLAYFQCFIRVFVLKKGMSTYFWPFLDLSSSKKLH